MPFEKWLVAFIKAVISPSRRIWHKEPKIISFLAPEFSHYLRRGAETKVAVAPDKHRLETFLTQLKSPRKEGKIDNLEKTRLLMLDFGESEKISVFSANASTPSAIAESLKDEERALGAHVGENPASSHMKRRLI